MKVIFTIFLFLYGIYLNTFFLLAHLFTSTLGVFPAYLVWRFMKSKAEKDFKYYFERITFPWAIFSSIVLFAITQVFFLPNSIMLIGMFIQPVIIGLSLTDSLPTPPSLFTFSLKKLKNWIKGNPLPVTSTIIIFLLLFWFYELLSKQLYQLQAEFGLLEIQINTFQAVVFTWFLLLPFFLFV